jgi:transcription elongation factor Elf1
LCPKCGSDSCVSTLAGYTYVAGEEDKYMDLNDCTCNNCGNHHKTHERVETFKK